MKWKILLSIISVIAVSPAFLRREDVKDSSGNVVQLDSKTVKSPGEFTNVAPEAKGIVTPNYAAPKVEVNLRVTTDSLVSKDFQLGSTPIPKIGERIDHGSKYPDYVPHVENRQMQATSTVWAKTHNFEKVTLDVGTGKAVPEPNVFNQKKVLHGTNPQ